MVETQVSIDDMLASAVSTALKKLYGADVQANTITFQQTRKEFPGDRTLVVFPFLKLSKRKPEETAYTIGETLKAEVEVVEDFNVVAGFLNLAIKSEYWLNWLQSAGNISDETKSDGTYLVEYSSPNTNKPLHLGHIRNNLLGYSVSKILKANGKDVAKVQVINDRGIHICKSMLAWQKFGKGVTPVSSGKKGDHLVGEFYVKYNEVYKGQVKELMAEGLDEQKAEQQAEILQEARKMLQQWEQGDPEIIDLWKTMNGWVYEGFATTYKNLGVDFDRLYYESETYLLGKEVVMKGLKEGIFFQKEDDSVWVDLTEYGLDEKLLIRTDGTSVYMTQDIGTAILRTRDYPEMSKVIYTVGDEQNYHFKVLFLILKKLGYKWAEACEHLSYGMVELPSGKMKSREGTVVDADDLLEEMYATARRKAEELGKLEGLNEKEQNELFRLIGLGALKYFILRVDPRKQIIFNPEESIDFNGNTGPFIQYTHARIKTLVKKSSMEDFTFDVSLKISDLEKDIIKQLYSRNGVIAEAGKELNPSLVANYTYELVKTYNQFYQTVPVLKEEVEAMKNFRLALSEKVASTIQSCMALLGIEVPERM